MVIIMETQQYLGKPASKVSLNSYTNLNPGRASRIVGYSWILMFILAIPTVLLVLEKLVVKGDTAASLENIKGNELLLFMGIAAYFIILTLDAAIGIGLYSVLKYSNQGIAKIMTILRLLFVVATAISLIALSYLEIEFYSIGVLVGYVFLIPHLFLIGYLALNSGYISKSLSIFMIITSFAYIITMFGQYLLSSGLYDVLYPIAMIPASFGEITMGIYLIVKSKHINQVIEGY